jgi:putative intracellular protease/amidase
MKGRTFLTACLGSSPGNLSLFLVILLTTAVCWGQEPQTEGRRRTPRVSRLRTVQLPEPTGSSGVSVEQALTRLRSLTPPSDQRLQQPQVGQLLWAGQGVAMPRAGSVTASAEEPPIRIYVVLPDGVYVYSPGPHALQQTSEADVRGPLAAAVLNQQAGPIGGCQIILAGSSRDYSARYGNRARTVMLLQAGQMVQSMELQAVSQDLTFIAVDNVDAAGVRRILRLARGLEPLYVLLVGQPAAQTPPAVQQQPLQGPPKRAVLIVPQTGFQDEELFAAKRGLELASVQTVIASMRIGAVTGSLGGVAQSELLLGRVQAEDFDAVVFIGGPGTVELLNNRMALDLARRAATLNKVVAASGSAPAILANAGIINGARVTGLLAERDRLLLAGGLYTGAPVEKDGPLVTSAGPLVVPQFVMAILDALAGR